MDSTCPSCSLAGALPQTPDRPPKASATRSLAAILFRESNKQKNKRVWKRRVRRITNAIVYLSLQKYKQEKRNAKSHNLSSSKLFSIQTPSITETYLWVRESRTHRRILYRPSDMSSHVFARFRADRRALSALIDSLVGMLSQKHIATHTREKQPTRMPLNRLSKEWHLR